MWWEDVLGGSTDPVRAFHELGREARRHGAVAADYGVWETQVSDYTPRADRPRKLLDRKNQRQVVWDAVRELVRTPRRRVTCVLVYGSAGNLVDHFSEQAVVTLKDWSPELARIQRLALRFPRSRDELTPDDLLERFRDLTQLQPGQPLERAFKARRGGGRATPVHLLDWDTYGEGHRPPLRAQHLETWLTFCCEHLAPACPRGARLLSFVALVVERGNQEKLRQLVEELREEPDFRQPHFEIDPPEAAEARLRLGERRVADYLTEHAAAAPYYKIDEDLETAINMALATGSPLLVTGEPGTGKTQLAYFLREYFAVEMRAFHVKSTSTARDLKYEFDAVGYLQSAYAAREDGEKKERSDFLTQGPLWDAYEDADPSVLLIDEIDKAPRDFPNDLLHEIDQGWFPHPFDRGRRIPEKKGKPPIVVITSNVERRLPGPFLRRCVFHHIELTEALVRHAVAARAGEFPRLASELRQLALDRFWDLREQELQKPPSTAELLVWLAILNARGTSAEELRRPLGELPALGSLIKDKDDLDRLR